MGNYLFTRNRVFKQKKFFSNVHVCTNGLVKMCASKIFHFSRRILTTTHTKVYNIFVAYYMSRCPTFTFQPSIMSKWLAKHISTKVSFKITIRKRHVWIDIRWPWKWNQYFYLGIWNDERTKIIFLNSFQLVTRLNLQNRNETSLLINPDTFICVWILVFPIGIIQVSNPRIWSVLIYFTILHDYWPPSTLISLVHISLGALERYE